MTGKEADRQKVRALEEADPQEAVMILLLEQKGLVSRANAYPQPGPWPGV